MWIKSIYGKSAFKRLKLYICRAGIVTATSECQWPCGLRWVGARSFSLGSVLVWGGWHCGTRSRVSVHALGFPTLPFRATDVVGEAAGDRSSLAIFGKLALLWI